MSFLQQAWQHILDNIVAPTRPSAAQLLSLVSPFGRSSVTQRHAASVILARVQFLSLCFAVLVPACALIDLLLFPPAQAWQLTALRLAAGLAFGALAWPRAASLHHPYRQALALLLAMLMIPALFYLAALSIIQGLPLTPAQETVVQLYALMPTLVLAGLAIFPLSALEILLFSLPVLAIAASGLIGGGEPWSWSEHGTTFWFMAMMIGVAMISGMSQTHYMESLVQRASTDPLTGALTRRTGIESLERLLRHADGADQPLAVAFIDVDHFKSINDQHGHQAGDDTLCQTVAQLRTLLRRGDQLVRWGGEEFVVLLPDMPASQLPTFLMRLRDHGLGSRPDGSPLQVSVGLSERLADGRPGWPGLVALADRRLYEAKRRGRARAVLADGSEFSLVQPGDRSH